MLKNVSLYLIQLFLICLPFDHFYSEVVLIALTVHTALLAKREDFRKMLQPRVLGIQAIYGVTLLATIYSPYKPQAFDAWFQQLPLFALPLLCVLWGPLLMANRDRLLTTFALTCVGVILYLYADALRVILYFHMPLSSLFSHSFVNQHFSAPLDMHATYLSLYVGLCLCYCLTRGLRTRNAVARPPRRRSPWFFVAALILAIGLVQLSSKSVWVGMILVGTLAAPYCLSSGRQRLRAFIGSLALVSALGAFLLSGPFFQQRMIADFNRDMVADPTQNVGNEPRMVRWVAAWSMIKASPVLGYGSGSEKPVMEDAYFTQALYEPFLLGLNVHNQFLSWWLKTGLPGLLVYIGMLGWGFYAAVRAKDLVWICFVVLVTMVSLAENILDVQHGLFFFAFFFSFFFFAHRPSTPRWYHGS